MTPAADTPRGTVLVLYALSQHPLRSSVRDHLYPFRRYSRHRCIYVNLAVQTVPAWALKGGVDAIIFHTTLLSQRWQPESFEKLLGRTDPVRCLPAVKLAFPQDEFIHTDILCNFIDAFGIDHVFSVAPPSEWRHVYRDVDRSRTEIHQTLTGYLEESTIARVERLAGQEGNRTIDVGYRAWDAAMWLGRHGLLKRRIADVFAREAPRRGLVSDISTRSQDTLLARYARSARAYAAERGHSPLTRREELGALAPSWVLAARRRLPTHDLPSAAGLLPREIREELTFRDYGDPPPGSLDEHLRRDLLSRNLPALLRFEDRNSMAHSIEARVPFLDHRVVEYAFTLRDEERIQGVETKRVLRRAMRGIVPDAVLDRRDKIGFRAEPGATARLVGRHRASLMENATEQERRSLDREAVTKLFSSPIRTTEEEFLTWRVVCTKLWLRAHWG